MLGPQPVHKIKEKVNCAHSPLWISRMEGLAGKSQGERFGALGSTHHLAFGRLTHHKNRCTECLLGEGLGAEGAGFLAAQNEQAETVPAGAGKLQTRLVHRKNLPLGVAGATAAYPIVLESRRNIRRHGIHMGTEYHLRCAPAEEDIDGAVAHLESLHRLSLEMRSQPKAHLPLPAGSGIDGKYFAEQFH